MPVDWTHYDAFDWDGTRQFPMNEQDRADVAQLAVSILGLAAEDDHKVWGDASPPGRYAATVIRVHRSVRHGYLEQAAAHIEDVGVKILKANTDSQRVARGIVSFHQEHLRNLPGLPLDRVPQSLHAGLRGDARGVSRCFVVQQWVPGDTLEDLINRVWPAEPISADVARSIIEQLFAQIVGPLWERGTVWWDVRAANFCYHRQAGRLSMIDVDSLAAYAEEIVETPRTWDRRDKGRLTALTRLRKLTLRIWQAQGGLQGKKVEGVFRKAWEAELEPALLSVGKVSGESVRAALDQYFDRLEDALADGSAG